MLDFILRYSIFSEHSQGGIGIYIYIYIYIVAVYVITRRANIEMETSSKADSPGGVDQVTKSRICRDSFKETSEIYNYCIFVEKVSALNEHNGNSALHMYFGVPDDDHLPDNVLKTALVCQIQADQTRDYWLRVIGDEFNRRVEEAEVAKEN